jgi:cold shock CspA family protein
MLVGTISDLDPDGLFGVIDADDGRLVLFNLKGVDCADKGSFKVGTRVEFVERSGDLAPRALSLSRVVHA